VDDAAAALLKAVRKSNERSRAWNAVARQKKAGR
jgi:hypothetical protein